MNTPFSLPFVLLSFSTPLLLSLDSLADSQENTFYDNVEWAKNAQNEAYNPSEMTLNLSDFCSDNNPGCESQIRQPDEAGMTDAQITNQSTLEFGSNEHAQAIQEGFDNNSATIDPNDDTYRFATLGIENAYEISHGQSNQYVDCDNATQCVIDNIAKQCHRPTNNNVPCTKVPVATVSTSEVIYRCPSGWTKQGIDCQRPLPQCRYNNKHYVSQTGGDGIFSSSRTTYLWGGKQVSPNQGYTLGELKQTYHVNWQASERWDKRYEICRPTTQTKKATLSCSNGFTLSGGNCIKNTITWRTQCSLMNSCNVTRQQCIEGRATRTINGIPTTLDCWKYRVDHQCTRPNTCNVLPADCTTTSIHCSLQQNGVCIEEKVNKSCPQRRCSATQLICGEESFCLDGDCFEAMATTSNRFNESTSALAALAEAADGLGDPPMIFAGKGMKCTDAAFGFADCCKDGGWGTSIGIAQCNDEEKALGQAKEQGITIALGSYCAEKVLGACIRKKKTYCVFDSKLARIIQEQGSKGQLGISLGTAKHPICGALTPEQLQDIDFERLDFSDFYDDMHSNTNLPSATEIQERLQSAYRH
ncbi:type-F conjugative transfer system mating-pair stabilization protein TraN [Vibrio sp. 10N.222.54.A1]|uniref:Type-F conjugative transfer system mating-pair stabilization protein TraN n=1 Tax=Vibrio cyclitrophicus TaxID=47951 RepID=A0ACD5FZL0_9VIBR|nr:MULTISPECIES: type-F conjugative transfer system mating-pair stabilization protein TraN [Vibrio]TKF78739.1 type-F conjugative transfer system mating-pair stabilization protein TraN [Vibrio sp. F13]